MRSRSKRLSFVAEGQFWPNNHVHILKPYDGDERYFAELLESLDYEQYVEGAAQPKLTAKELGDIQIPVPPKSQQQQLRDRVMNIRDRRNEAINCISDTTRVLEERRQALITAAVTDQIDMSEA